MKQLFQRERFLLEHRGWLVWAAYASVLIALVFLQPGRRMLSLLYLQMADQWWAGRVDLYTPGIKGFLYLPQSVYAFTPFTWPGYDVGNALWRVFGVFLFAFGIRRMARHLGGEHDGKVFTLATLLALSASGAAARTGQSNLHLIGCMLHAGSDLVERRWWRATFMLWLGMAMKPLAMAMILLTGALHGPMRWRLLVGLVLFAALPFAHPDPAWVLRQYEMGIDKVIRSSQPGEKPYADIVGLARTVGIYLPPAVRTVMQAVAALLTLGLCAVAARRLDRMRAVYALVALASCYLVLFNPRTETNSYVILIPHVALAGSLALLVYRRKHAFAGLAVTALALGCDNYGRPFHNLTSPWLKPAVALCLFVLGAWLLLRLPRREETGPR